MRQDDLSAAQSQASQLLDEECAHRRRQQVLARSDDAMFQTKDRGKSGGRG